MRFHPYVVHTDPRFPPRLDTLRPLALHRHMEELLRTNDITVIAYARALLQGEGIDCFELDVNMSVLEGSIGILPRRIMVRADDHRRADRLMREAGLIPDG